MWSLTDPKAMQPEGDGGECPWKRCRELVKQGLLRDVLDEEGKQLRLPGIHPVRGGRCALNEVFEITEQGRAWVASGGN